MKVTYIFHSGFLIETADAYFLFDYYKGEIPQIHSAKPLVVFVSHKHHDHYNKAIFNMIKDYPDTKYVLSKDISVRRLLEQDAGLRDRITLIGKAETKKLLISNGKELEITTLRSTDEGVAFLLKYDEQVLYHAGDLNLWVWEGETKQYNNNMTANYFRELEKIKGMDIDVAFVPLDPRQEQDAFAGLESFMEYTNSKYVFPMHVWEQYGIIEDFIAKHPEYARQTQKVNEPGQMFEIL